ncbi:hypothetical protein SESBI_15071 [Sesbania bispinosa]|nr:hypothetical protein SESBI_15071 [Sesbania bispinosa]
MEIDNWSYFEALSIVKELRYVGGVKLWWRVGKCEGKYEYRSITWDNHALEMANYAIDHNCEVNLVVEHVSVAVPNLIESVPEPELVKETQVQKGRNCDGHQVKGVNGEDNRSEERFDGSLENFCFDDSEEERNFGSDDGFGEVQMHNLSIEETPHTECLLMEMFLVLQDLVVQRREKDYGSIFKFYCKENYKGQIPTQSSQIQSTRNGAPGSDAGQGGLIQQLDTLIGNVIKTMRRGDSAANGSNRNMGGLRN